MSALQCISLFDSNSLMIVLQLVGNASGNMGLCECWCIWACNYCKFFLFPLKMTLFINAKLYLYSDTMQLLYIIQK